MNFYAFYYGSSGWLIDLDGFRILIDPWLTGDLFFSPPGPWLINGRLRNVFDVPEKINLLLLTQGLADHAHPASLKLLDRSIPGIGSPSAFKVLDGLGFQNVNAIKPNQTIEIGPISIEATSGAPVPQVENGYIVSHEKYSFYVEPHGYLDPRISPRQIDLAISPVIDLKLPFAGAFIRGKTILPKLIELLKPKTIFSSTTGGDATFTGLLNSLISVDGTQGEAAEFLNGKSNFVNPEVGVPYKLKI